LTQIDPVLPANDRLGRLGVAHLVRMWARASAGREGRPAMWSAQDIDHDLILLAGLGLGLEPTTACLWQTGPTLHEFEDWILEQKGGPLDPMTVRRVNALVLNQPYDDETIHSLQAISAASPVLDHADLRSWHEHGYVILHDAISAEECAAVSAAIWDFLGASADDPETWYSPRLNGIMVQLFQHAALDVARRSARIHKAFAQLWGTPDLPPTTDRCGFNPPEQTRWRFPGPRLHWDVAPEPPVPFGVQGLIYLTNTAPDQGAFTCVPGFHREIDRWIEADPRRGAMNGDSLRDLVGQPIPGRRGDMVIWNHALPHGSSANRSALPRIVQYLTLAPPATLVNLPRRER
jgi:hypothetical protein